MKNRRNIIESELPPQNPLDIWMKDGKFYRSTNKGWVLIEDQMEFTNSELMSKSTATSGTIGVNKETGEASIYNDVTKEWNPLGGGGGMTETTWQELKDKRDNGELVPGALYRITDYNCTTTQENTQSAGHLFDIVLLALSENKLAEEGWAMEHPTDVYDVTFADGVTKKCYIYQVGDDAFNVVDVDTLLGAGQMTSYSLTINEENKTATFDDAYEDSMIEEGVPYNYFQNSNLSAWKVWYCLDNDKSRFAWADDSVDEGSPAGITVNNVIYVRDATKDVKISNKQYYGWINNNVVRFTRRENNIDSFTTVYEKSGNTMIPLDYNPSSYIPPTQGTGLPNGRGVIYRLIDEWNNDIKYDFKNIQFKRTITNGQYDVNGTETWCYTLNVWYNDMCQDASVVGNTIPNDEGYVDGVYDNNFGYATAYDFLIEGVNTFAFALGNNVVLSVDYGSEYYGIYSNTIGNNFCSNTIGDHFYSNAIGNGFCVNTVGNMFNNNIIGNAFYSNTIGNSFFSNTIGNYFVNKTISNNTSYKNYGNNGVELATKDDLN